MIIDCVLDRKDGTRYCAKNFYDYLMYGFALLGSKANERIMRAMDCGTEEDVQRELCRYIDDNCYNPDIKEYVYSVSWLEDDPKDIELKQLLNDNFFIYCLEFGGMGIVKADSPEEAERKVREAYTKHSDGEFTEEIRIYELNNGSNWVADNPDVLELLQE